MIPYYTHDLFLGVRPELSLPGTRLESQTTSNLHKSSRSSPASRFTAAYVARHGMCPTNPSAVDANMTYSWDKEDVEYILRPSERGQRTNTTQTVLSDEKSLISKQRSAGSFLPASLLESMFAMTIFDDGKRTDLSHCTYGILAHCQMLLYGVLSFINRRSVVR